MIISEAWDILVAPFPFVDRPDSKPRPILVLSAGLFNQLNGHTITAMITTGKGNPWPGDKPIAQLDGTGLNVPSVIRPKLFTLDNRILKKRIGALQETDRRAINQYFSNVLALRP